MTVIFAVHVTDAVDDTNRGEVRTESFETAVQLGELFTDRKISYVITAYDVGAGVHVDVHQFVSDLVDGIDGTALDLMLLADRVDGTLTIADLAEALEIAGYFRARRVPFELRARNRSTGEVVVIDRFDLPDTATLLG